MDSINTLLNIILTYDNQVIARWINDSSVGDKTTTLLKGIQADRYKTNEEAMLHIYNDLESGSNFRKLKSRLKEKLVDELLTLNLEKRFTSRAQKTLHKSLKNWVSAKLLLDIGYRNIAVELMEAILVQTLKYDQIELSLMLVKELKLNFGVYRYNKQKHNKYLKLYPTLKKTYDLKEVFEELFASLGYKVSVDKSMTYNDEIQNTERKIEELSTEVKRIDSYYLRFYYYNVKFFINMIKKDFNER